MATVLAQAPSLRKRSVIKWALIAATLIWSADIVYRLAKDVSYVNREQCVLYRALPRLGFLAYEYIFETLVIVFVGTFIAVWLSRRFMTLRRFMPRNPVAAFLYGAAVPICSCAVIPLAGSMRERLGLTTTMAFIVAAPLLSPYIIVLSFSVLGPTYALVRIGSAFVLTMVCAFAVGRLGARHAPVAPPATYAQRPGCSSRCAASASADIYLQTLGVFKALLPYLVVAAAFGIGLEYLGPRQFLMRGGFADGPLEVIIWALLGVPLYFCSGAEVLFLRPLVSHGFPIGTAIAFSLTSTAVCLTSIAMLFKLIGARLTLVLAGCVTASAIGLAFLINWLV